MRELFSKATIGENESCCDKCGRVGKVGELFTLYSTKGDYVHLCRNCLDPDGWGQRW